VSPKRENSAEDRFARELDALEEDLERLKTLYEQYFLGIERLAPARLRNEIRRRILTTKPSDSFRTAERFRFRTLSQRFTSYSSYWDRMLAMIEDGTFRRDRTRNPDGRSSCPAAPSPPSARGRGP
jgi:hypothetical protein